MSGKDTPATSVDGDKLDKILSLVTEVGGRVNTLSTRMDSMEKDKMDAKAKADAEEKERCDAKAKADADEKERCDAKAKADAEEKERMDAKAKADAAARQDSDLHARLKAIEQRVTDMPEEDRQLFARSQLAAEPVYQAFGDAAGAPRWLNGETRNQYRRRLLTKALPHSARWKDVDISAFNDKALDVVETQVYADAMQTALNPARVPAGRLQMVTRKDETGRSIKEFLGNPADCWGRFQQPIRYVTGYQSKFERANRA